MATTDKDLMDWIYDTVLQVIKSPQFRNPLKDFIDDNCSSFIGLDENTFEQGNLHKAFIALADNLLETMTQELDITEEMFCMAAKRGLEDQKENRKYFEQLIAFNNYSYFKSMMTKRNLHLEKLAYEAMMKDKEKEIKPENKDNNEELKKLIEEQNIAEKGELEAALKMSLAVEEEAKKLKELEDAELEKAIKLSLLEQQQRPNPSPLIQANPNLQIKLEPQAQTEKPKEQPKPEPKKEEVKETQPKLNPIDKVALKQKQLKEHDEKMKNIVQTKQIQMFSDKNNESLNKKLEEMEANKAKALQQYREMLMKMKKEKRHQEEKEGTDVFSLEDKEKEKEKEGNKPTGEDEKIKQRKLLAEQLKAKLKKK